MNRIHPALLVAHALVIAFLAAPIVVVALVSFTPSQYLSIPTTSFSLRWYEALLHNGEFLAALRNSGVFALSSSVVATAICVPAGIALGRQKFRGSETIKSTLLSPLMVPSIVLGIAFLKFLTLIGLVGTTVGLILCHCVIITPYVLRLAMSSAAGLDRNAELAATSLGATRWTVFRKVTVPLVMPGVVSGWLIGFITSFDELTVTVFVASPSTTTLPVKLFNHITETTDPLAASVSGVIILLAAVVMVVVDKLYGLEAMFVGKK